MSKCSVVLEKRREENESEAPTPPSETPAQCILDLNDSNVREINKEDENDFLSPVHDRTFTYNGIEYSFYSHCYESEKAKFHTHEKKWTLTREKKLGSLLNNPIEHSDPKHYRKSAKGMSIKTPWYDGMFSL